MAQQLSGQVVLRSVKEGEKTTEVVATFSDTNTTDPAASFSAIVDWGDGTTEVGTVTGANGSFAVSVPDSTHFYADEGNDPITVTITGTAGGNIAPTNLQYFLAIDGLNGGSTDAAHVGWFDVSSYDIGALIAAVTQSKTFSPLTVTLPSTGLTGLFADLAEGTGITSVRLEGVTNTGEAAYDLTLGNVTVSNYTDAPGGGQVSFNYQQVALTTTEVKPDGSLGTSQSFSWDRTRNQPGGDIPAPTPNPAAPNNITPGDLHYFLAIDGLNGGTRDAGHAGWFDVSSYDVGALVAAMAGRATFSPLDITFASAGLTDVLADLANRTNVTSMRLEGVTNTGQAVYDLTLGNVTVNNYADAPGGAQLSFSYQQVALTTTGSSGNSQTFSWNVTRGQPGGSIAAPTPGTAAGNTAPDSNLDYFLAIDGIDGQSADRTHLHWLEVTGYDFGAVLPTTGSSTFTPLTVTLDASGLTTLFADLADTTSPLIRSVRLEGVTRGPNRQAVYDITLGQVRVSDYEDTSSGDTLGFTYRQVDLTTTAINPDGSRGGSQTFSWDRLNNVPGTSPISAPSAGGTLAGASPTDATYFLAIDGLNGGATDPTHRGWFEVSSHDFSVQITAGRPTFSPLTVTLSATGSTGVLADLLEGATLPPPTGPSGSFPIRSMRLEGVIGNDQVVYDLTLGNVTVTNYQDASGGDTLTFSYQQIALATVPQNNDGSFGNPLTFGWDVPTRQEITAGSIPDPAPRVTPSTAGNVVPANLHYFLAINGLNGGSVDAAHPGWFDVSSYDFTAQLMATGSLPRFSPLTVTLPSTGLTGVLANLAPGTDVTSVRLEGVNTAGQAVYDLTLGNAAITNYADVSGGNQLSFDYQQVSLTTRAINANGSLGASQTSGWDLAQNTALGGSIPAPVPGGAAGNVAPAHLHYFLAIDGLNGGSTDAAHAGWFDVSIYEFDAKHPAAAGRATFSPLAVTLPSTGVTSVFADLAQLSTINSVRLEGVTDMGQAVYDLTLGSVAVTKYSDAASGAQLSFSYQQVALTTTAVNANGSLGNSQSFSWDVPQNAPGGPIVPPIPNAASGQIMPSGAVTVTEGDVLTPFGTTFNVLPGHAFSGTVATFTDTNINNVASDFSATINWGDGTSSVGTIIYVAGAIGVSGTHTYATTGTDTVLVTLAKDAPGTATATATSTAQVTQPLSGQIVPTSITEGTATTGVIATFSDTDTTDAAGNFTAVVNWGDGTTEAGTVAGANGSFAVSVPGSTHFYADEGTAQPVVTITRTTDNDQIALTGTVTVAEGDVLTPSGVTFNALLGKAFSGTVATFTDSNINNVASDFVATIDWGDGTSSVGTVTYVAGAIDVSGTHTYAAPGTDNVVVTLTEDAPGTATAMANSMAQVAQPLSGQVILTSITEGQATTGVVATFSDADTTDTAGSFTAVINWGDGTTEAGTVAGSDGSFSVSVPGTTHFYADEGTAQPVVTITRTADGDQITPTGTVTVTEGDVLTPSGLTITVQQGQTFNGTVATFSDTNTNSVASDFVATIDWGDGTTTSGVVTDEAGHIGVSGTHTYVASGTDSITVTLTEDAPGTATATATSVADITPCYCNGTLILTDRGEVSVETLTIGDHVITADGAARPIRWIGQRSYAGRFARGTHVLPICFKAGALDVNSPRRDLWVSPHHAMFLDGVLIEALDLVNGVSIIQAERVERVDYFHIELDSHDIIVAEGALSESFVDDDSRGMFQNAHEFAALYPDMAASPARYCAPRVAFGAPVEAVRQRIAHRAGIPYRRPAAESSPRALVVDSRLPQVGHDGGANAVLDHMRALQAAGFEVSFLALIGGRKDASALHSLGVTPLPSPPSGLFVDAARANAGMFDLIYLHRVESASRCLKPARRYFDAQVVYSVADLHHIRLKSQSGFDHEHASELMQQAGAVALQELAAAMSADCVITHSQSEAEKLGQLPGIAAERKVHVVPWTVQAAAVQTPFRDRSGVAFIGNFAHAPNADAVRWLVEEIMPLVWQTEPDLPCLIAGSDTSDELHQQLTRPGVRLLGRVARLGDVFEQARLTIAPLRFGAGLKDKVLRSMAAGLPCVGTSEAFDGMQGLPVAITDACRRDTAAGLAAAIIRMHRDEAANASCAQTGLKYIGAFYNEARVNALIRELAQPALDRYRTRARTKPSQCQIVNFAPSAAFAQAAVAVPSGYATRRIVFN